MMMTSVMTPVRAAQPPAFPFKETRDQNRPWLAVKWRSQPPVASLPISNSASRAPIFLAQKDHYNHRLIGLHRKPLRFQGGKTQQVDLPVVNLKDFQRGTVKQKQQFLDSLGKSLSQFGFVAIADHGVEPQLIRDYYRALEGIFSLPEQEKKRYVRADLGRARGYYELGQEKKSAVLGQAKKFADKKENWHSGPPETFNVFPETQTSFTSEQNQAIEQFKVLNPRLYQQLEAVSVVLAEAIGQCLDDMGLADNGYLKSLLQENGQFIANSLMRSIHYPPVPEAERAIYEPGVPVIRAGDHRDMNLFTLLPEATEAGLEIQPLSNILKQAGGKQGDWLPIHSQQGNLIMNVGDMLALITGGKIDEKGQIIEQGVIPSIRHRVVGNTDTLDKPRYSIPFFVHPHLDKTLMDLKTKQPVISALEFNHRRLSAHGSLGNKTLEAFRKDSENLMRKPL